MHARLLDLLRLPRAEQPAAIEALLASMPEPEHEEAWNTRFGPASLYAAWTCTSLVRGLYAANTAMIRTLLAERCSIRAVEIGGGTGALWRHALREGDRVELVVVDPSEEACANVPGARAIVARVQDAVLPEADLVVCSLTLHHVAGEDREHRAAHGLEGVGKLEALRAMAASVRPRDGVVLLNEADIYCDLDLPPGDPVLVDRLVDSYVRRCAVAVLDDLEGDVPASLARRWRAIVRHWCLEQPRVAALPVAERDVYELDVPRWLTLLDRAGLTVIEHAFTDRYGLFHRYVARAR